MYKLFCDLCEKEITSKEPNSQYKIKKLRASFSEFWWNELHVHDECVKKLYEAVDKEKNNG